MRGASAMPSLSMLVRTARRPAPVASVDAACAPQPRDRRAASTCIVDGRTIPVQIRPAGAFGRQNETAPARAGAGPQRVVSPMPGKVVRVLVKAGDEVKARQGLVVVEAMKMENELRAARDGRVREVARRRGPVGRRRRGAGGRGVGDRR